MTIIVPDSWGSPLREFNSCHNPPGKSGGQFCAKGGGSLAATRAENDRKAKAGLSQQGWKTRAEAEKAAARQNSLLDAPAFSVVQDGDWFRTRKARQEPGMPGAKKTLPPEFPEWMQKAMPRMLANAERQIAQMRQHGENPEDLPYHMRPAQVDRAKRDSGFAREWIGAVERVYQAPGLPGTKKKAPTPEESFQKYGEKLGSHAAVGKVTPDGWKITGTDGYVATLVKTTPPGKEGATAGYAPMQTMPLRADVDTKALISALSRVMVTSPPYTGRGRGDKGAGAVRIAIRDGRIVLQTRNVAEHERARDIVDAKGTSRWSALISGKDLIKALRALKGKRVQIRGGSVFSVESGDRRVVLSTVGRPGTSDRKTRESLF